MNFFFFLRIFFSFFASNRSGNFVYISFKYHNIIYIYIYIPGHVCFVFFSAVSVVLSHIKSWSSTMIIHSLVSIGKMKLRRKLESGRISISQLSSTSSRSKLRQHITSPFGSAILGKKSQYRFQTGVLAGGKVHLPFISLCISITQYFLSYY